MVNGESMSFERILRSIPLTPSDELILPVGIQRPGELKRYREITIDEMCGKDEENIAKAKVRRNASKACTVLLRRCVQEIPGLIEAQTNPYSLVGAEFVREWMTQIDRDFLLLAVLVLSGQDTTEVRGYCEDCDEAIIEPVAYKDLEVFDWPEDAPLEITDTLPRGYKDRNGDVHKDFVMSFPNGVVQEKILAQAKGNAGLASTLLHASCMKKLGTLEGIDSDIASRLKATDRQYIGHIYQTKFPGVNLMRKIECEICGKELERAVDLSGFFVKAWAQKERRS